MLTEQIMAVLQALPEPAFLWKNGGIAACNAACTRLPLNPGDPVPALEEAELPAGNSRLHFDAVLCGREWELTVQPAEEGHLVLLQPMTRDNEDLFRALARSLQPPVTSILSAGGRLFPELEELENENIQLTAAAITRGSFRLLRMLDSLREYSRLSRDEESLQTVRLDIQEFFAGLAAQCQDALADAGLRLEYQGPKSRFPGNLDPVQVRRAVLNLLSNAAVYAEPGTPVELSVTRSGSKLQIRVSNRGPAMDADVLATAFSRYRRTGDVEDPRWGAGLGLPLVQVIARKHSGSVFLTTGDSGTAVTMVLSLDIPPSDRVDSPRNDLTGGYNPILVELSGLLPNATFDSRNLDL